MCILIPDWPVQRLALARPELHGRAVVLYEASPQGGLKVVAAASALGLGDHAAEVTGGIYPDMPLAEAVALLAHAGEATSSEPLLQPADADADYLGLVQLAEWCQRFSPITGVEDAPRPDCLLLDVSGLGHLFGGEAALAEEVHRAFAGRGLDVRVAVADTIGAAWAAAHTEPLEAPENRFRFLQILPDGESLTALAPLPIGYLRVAEETAALLATLGIYRIGQLAGLPRWALLSRFGPDLLRRLDQALGRAPEMIVARHRAPEYTAEFTCEAPLANREAIEHVLGQLIARLTGPLSRRREGVLSLLCRLQYERAFEEGAWATEKDSLTFCIGLFRASASAEYLCDLLRLRLESVRLAGPVTSLHVEVTAVGPLEQRQQALFDSDAEQDQPRRLAGLVDRLSNRLGRAAVVQTALLADAQPEYTCVDVPAGVWRLSFAAPPCATGSASAPDFSGRERRNQRRPPAEPGAKRSGKGPRKKSGKKNLTHVRRYGLLSFAPDERPLELLRQPARIEIVALSPHGAPAQFRFAGRSYAVAYAWGPERIETGWWRTAHAEQDARKTFVRRDYYRIETASGARFWIFRLLGSPRWFLHGRFE